MKTKSKLTGEEMATLNQKPLLSVEELAQLLSCSPMTIYRRIGDGSLSHIRIGSIIRIPRRVLDDLLEVCQGPVHG